MPDMSYSELMEKTTQFNELPPLKSLKGFEATARLNSAARAADELHVTPPAITHQIQKLEQSLGVELFVRQGRSLVLTDAGKAFYPFAHQALVEVKKGLEALRLLSNKPDPLRIQTYVTAGIRWLAPRITRFHHSHPNIQIKLDSNSGWKFDSENTDLGLIFLETPPDDDFCWHPLFPYALSPICSPNLLASLNTPLTYEDVTALPLLSVHTEELHWEMWLSSVGLCPDNLNPAITVDTSAIALEMALNEEGVALINGPFAERELSQGILVKPFRDALRIGEWGIIYRKDCPKMDQVIAFLTWIEAECLRTIAN